MSILDNVVISCNPESGAIYLVKMNAGGTKAIDKRNCEREIIKALLLNMARGLLPGEGCAYPMKVTAPEFGTTMYYELQLVPISEAEYEAAE